jgi:hypothetical protein
MLWNARIPHLYGFNLTSSASSNFTQEECSFRVMLMIPPAVGAGPSVGLTRHIFGKNMLLSTASVA